MRKLLACMVLLLLVSSGALVLSTPSVRAGTVTLAIDGSVEKGCGSASCSVSLTTAQGSDIIMVQAGCSVAGIACKTSSSCSTNNPFVISDQSSLSWKCRVEKDSAGGHFNLAVYYAIASSALSSDTITVTSGDTIYVAAFGISGANTASPFDQGPGSNNPPTIESNPVSSTPSSAPMSTSNGNDMILLFNDARGGSFSNVPGFAGIFSGGVQFLDQYVLTSSPLSAQTYTYSASETDWIVFADAVQAASTSGGQLAIDGGAEKGCGSVSCSIALTTAQGPDVIIADAACGSGGLACTTSSSCSTNNPFVVTDTNGLSWHCRVEKDSAGGHFNLAEYYAIASGALTSDSIKATVSSGIVIYVEVFGISGANTVSPFDPCSGCNNGAVPTVNLNSATSVPQSVPTTTSNANDILLAWTDAHGGSYSGLSGFSSVSGGFTNLVQYEVVSATQSGRTYSYSASMFDWVTIIDAVQAASTSSHTTASVVTPNPASVAPGNMITFTATVTDTSGSPSTPTGAVSWSDGGAGGSFGGPSSCTLSSAGPSSSTCSITYTAPSAPGLITISASYSGDSTHSASGGISELTSASLSMLAIDGSVEKGCGSASCSVSLTTAQGSDIIMVQTACGVANTACRTSSSCSTNNPFAVSDKASLTWTCRVEKDAAGGHSNLAVYYAIASSALSSDTITVTSTYTIYVAAFGISGANTASPFDPGPGSNNPPTTKIGASSSTPSSAPMSTSNGNDMILLFNDAHGGSYSPVSGFAGIFSGGVQFLDQYVLTSSPLSAQTYTYSASETDWIVFADAVQAASTSSHTTASVVTPNPASVAPGNMITFTATVTDTSGSPSTPTGAVSWSDGGAGGSFGGPSSCTLSSAGPSSSTCSITYTAPSAPGLITISASYSGDSTHSASGGISSLTVTTSNPGNDWSSFTLNNQDSRYQANSTITSSNVGQITQKWSITTQKTVTSTPVTLNGNVYFADWGGNVYSVSISTGHLNWEVNLGGVPITATLALANGMVYVSYGVGIPGSGATKVYALSQSDGHTVWYTPLITSMDSIWASPIVYNGLVYVGVATNSSELNYTQRGEVFALNAMTGVMVWGFVTMIGTTGGAGVWGTVVVDPVLNSIYFGTSNSYGYSGSGNQILYSYSIISLDATTGALNWTYQSYTSFTDGGDLDFGSSANLFSVTIGSTTYNAIGLGSKDGKYYILDRTNGNVLETPQIGTDTYPSGGGGIIGLAGFIYLSANNPEMFIPSYYSPNLSVCCGVVKAYIPSTNTVSWQFVTPGTIWGSVAVIPGAVLVGDVDGNLYAISTASGQQLFHTSLSAIYGGVTEAEGYIFVPTATGVYAFS